MKKLKQFSTAVASFIFFWLTVNAVSPSELHRRHKHSRHRVYYRALEQSPATLREQGGIHPRGGNEYAAHNTSFIIYRHMQSEHGIQGTPSTDQASEHGPSAYVTLSTAGATRRSRSASWLYRIHAAPNIIDASTRDCEQETHIFALGGVPWTQVMAWSEVNFDSDVELIQHRVKESGFTPNPDYNSDGFGALDAHVVSPSSDWRFTGAEFWNPRDHYDAPRLSRQHWTTHMASLPECARQALGFDVDFPLVFGRGNSPISSQRSTCLQRPTLSHSANPVSLLNTPQVLTAIDYLSSTDEPCNVASLDVSARQQTLGTDALLFRSIVRLSCQNEHALRSVSPSSEAVLDRLAEGYEPATCHLIAMCNNFLQDQRGRKPPPRLGLGVEKPKAICDALDQQRRAAKSSQRVLLGFRTVSEQQARRYMAAETVTPDANVARAGMQLGRGVYTSPSTEDWAADYGWHCAIFADKAKADKVDKVHIPRRLFQEDLHHDPTRDIHHYIRQHHPGVDPARALLLAYIEQGPDLQMLIPFALLNANGGDLNLTVECADSREKVLQAIRPLVGSTTRAYYDDWARVKGELSELDDNDDWDAASDSSTDTSTQDDDAPLALLPQRRVLTLSLSPNHSERPRLVANAHSQPLQSAEAVSRLL